MLHPLKSAFSDIYGFFCFWGGRNFGEMRNKAVSFCGKMNEPSVLSGCTDVAIHMYICMYVNLT